MTLVPTAANPLQKLKSIFRKEKNPRRLLLQNMPKNGVCAEIGVWKGDFSGLILELTTPKKLHLIDPWTFQSEFSERMYGGAVAKNQGDMDDIYEGVKARFQKFQNVVYNKGMSDEVLNQFQDDYFDWVYIDGNHYYDYVMKDLEISLGEGKKGGIIAGDDYTWGKKDGYPVKQAVKDFINKNDLSNKLTIFESQFYIQL